MTIGGSIALIVLGAILAFAVQLDIGGVDLNIVGVILMVGGGIGMILGLFSYNRSRVVRRSGDRVVEERDTL